MSGQCGDWLAVKVNPSSAPRNKLGSARLAEFLDGQRRRSGLPIQERRSGDTPKILDGFLSKTGMSEESVAKYSINQQKKY